MCGWNINFDLLKAYTQFYFDLHIYPSVREW